MENEIKYLMENDLSHLNRFFSENPLNDNQTENSKYHFASDFDINRFEKSYLRFLLYNYYSEFVVSVEHEEIKSIIALVVDPNKSMSLNIQFIYSNDNLKNMIYFIKNDMKNLIIKSVNKIRIQINKADPKSKDIINILTSLGFKIENIRDKDKVIDLIYWI